ncbi:virulence-associated protein E [Nordella sp. HKS 07]|uniref:DUF7146 domain-containing protein n=1 Tax=Nordella sp. HKS 07 TaxID=2712222 RepID=UPI0013E14578|nr:toprim domain-containing protein [Nordella sp. HKS 07]QIG49491.1 virulence-associated protein E [Nordella sp. HKS 07]
MRAEFIAKALRGHKAGYAWMACCPAHDDQKPSLAISEGNDGTVLVHCFAGCGQSRVIAALCSRGLWYEIGRHQRRFAPRRPVAANCAHLDYDAAKRSEDALAIWRSAMDAVGTAVEVYLRSRGLDLVPPLTLRYHAGLKHPTGTEWPAMVALVTSGADGKPTGLHRTFLTSDGSAKAPVRPAKMMLGLCRGGVVRLAVPGDVLMVGEGIETCLSAMQASGHAAWAALSTSGLRTLDLPGKVRDVIVLADGDDAGEAAARDAALRWFREGRRVRIARPPRGTDFNDLLREAAA